MQHEWHMINKIKVLMAWAARLDNGKGYELNVKPVNILSSTGRVEDDVALMNQAIEQLVKTKPEQYLCIGIILTQRLEWFFDEVGCSLIVCIPQNNANALINQHDHALQDYHNYMHSQAGAWESINFIQMIIQHEWYVINQVAF
jgi:hypothetical protein